MESFISYITLNKEHRDTFHEQKRNCHFCSCERKKSLSYFFHELKTALLSAVQDLYFSISTYGACLEITANIRQTSLNLTAFITQP